LEAPKPVEDVDDDEGFQLYQPRKTTFFDSRAKP
jgi:hypothetical protein